MCLPKSGVSDSCFGAASGGFRRWRWVDESAQEDSFWHGFNVLGRLKLWLRCGRAERGSYFRSSEFRYFLL